MSSIALFPCVPALESGIIGELSSTLTLKIYTDEEILRDTAEKFGSNPERLGKMMFSKTSVFNQFTLEREKSINMFRLLLVEKLSADQGYLFYGFLSSLIPSQITEVLRVLIVDKEEHQIERGIKKGLSKKEAQKSASSHYVSACSWTDFLFQKEAYDSTLYDLVLPAENLSPRQITKEILSHFHKKSSLPTTDSQQAIQDMKLMAQAEQLLLNNGHKAEVRADNGKITLVIQNTVLNFSGLKKDLTELVQQLPEVKEASVENRKTYADNVYRQQKFELPSKVLFVDDEREFVQTVSQRLISRDVGTYGVYDGEEALELIAEDQPEVMVLDLKMPGLHGVEVLRKTKELAPDIEVIILTGHGTTKDMDECMQLGAFAYMNKPVDIEELSATIKAANDKVHSHKLQTT